MTLAEVREAEAPPEIEAIYAALRRATGVPLVNLIWRHLATLPGVLPWAFAATRGVLESGEIAAARARLATTVRLPTMGRAEPLAAGLDADARDMVLAVIDIYNRGNLTNLILLTALREEIAGTPRPAPPPPPRLVREAELRHVPELPRLDELPERTQALVREAAARHAGAAAGGVVPSLYLHLARWPGVLAALPRWIGPVLGDLDGARAAAVAAAGWEAAGIRPHLAMGAGVPAEHSEAVLGVLTQFTTAVIPDMVPVGLALRRVLG